MRSMVEGASPGAPSLARSPSTVLRPVPLPLRVRRWAQSRRPGVNPPNGLAPAAELTFRPAGSPPILPA